MDYIVRQIEYAADSFKSKANYSSNASVVVTFQDWLRLQKQKEQIFLNVAKKIQNIRQTQGQAYIVKRQISKIHLFVEDGRKNQSLYRLSKEIKLNYKRSYQIFQETLRNIAKNCKCDLENYRRTVRQKDAKKMKEQQRQQRIYEERRRREQQEQEERQWKERKWRQQQQQNDEDESWPYLMSRKQREAYPNLQNLDLFSTPAVYKKQEKQTQQQQEQRKQKQRKAKQAKQKSERHERIKRCWQQSLQWEEQQQRIQEEKIQKERRQKQKKQKKRIQQERKEKERRQKQRQQEEIRQQQSKKSIMGIHPMQAQYFQEQYYEQVAQNNIYGNYVPTYPNGYAQGQYLPNNGVNVQYKTGGSQVSNISHSQNGYPAQHRHYDKKIYQPQDGQHAKGSYFVPHHQQNEFQYPQQQPYQTTYLNQANYNHYHQIPHQIPFNQSPFHEGFKGIPNENLNSHSQFHKPTNQSTPKQTYVSKDGVTFSSHFQRFKYERQLQKIQQAKTAQNLQQYSSQLKNETAQQSQVPSDQPESCSKCKIQPEDILTINCSHNLCLICAAEKLKLQMKKSNPAKSITCQFCNQRTTLAAQSISQLLEIISFQRQFGLENLMNIL